MDISLYYTEAGTGFPLILLHGNDENHHYFDPQIHYFSRQYHVYAIDTRGHGQSPRGNAPFTLSQFADDLYDFMNEKGIEKAHILGYSDGGNIAILFALRHQERIEKLILNAANIFPTGLLPEVLASIQRQYEEDCYFHRIDRMEMMRLMTDEPMLEPAQLHDILVPTLVIAGDHDLILPEHTYLIYQNLANADLRILPGDHLVSNHHADQFNAVIEEFLNR